jgi:hypothetical protein
VEPLGRGFNRLLDLAGGRVGVLSEVTASGHGCGPQREESGSDGGPRSRRVLLPALAPLLGYLDGSCIPASSPRVYVVTTPHRRMQVNQNVGRTDRVIRAAIVAPLAIVVAAVLGVGTTGGTIALVAAAIMLGTAAVGFCPLYRLFGISSCPVASRS